MSRELAIAVKQPYGMLSSPRLPALLPPQWDTFHSDTSVCLFYPTLVSVQSILPHPAHIRSDNGPEFTAQAIRKWLNRLGVKTLFIEPGSPWENGYIESFNGKLRDELLNREVFTTLEEAKVLIEGWRQEYNQVRPHSARNYHPPAPETVLVPT